jgi:hypothetical protein
MSKKKNIHTQELRLLHMSITALRKNMNMQLDALQAKIETLLPQRRERKLTTKEMQDRIMAL